MEYRTYKDQDSLSVIGCGGVLLLGYDQRESDRIVSEAVDQGINYFDVAPSYGNGEAEMRMGPALEPYREDCFLACKTMERSADKAAFEFKQSLKRMRTDHFDLYQLHAIFHTDKDIDAAFSKGGVMELLIRKKEEGQIRYLGFSAHSSAAALAAMDRYPFDSILFPLNYACYLKGGFGKEILQAAEARGIARLGLKAMARQEWQIGDARREGNKCWYEPHFDPEMIKLAIRWTLSQPITAIVPSGEILQFSTAVELAQEPIKPLSEEEFGVLTADLEELYPMFPRVTP